MKEPSALHKTVNELKKLSKILEQTLNTFELEKFCDEESLSANVAEKNLDKRLALIEKKFLKVVKNVQTERRKLET